MTPAHRYTPIPQKFSPPATFFTRPEPMRLQEPRTSTMTELAMQPTAPPQTSPATRVADMDVLPDPPAWLLGFFVGCAVFVSVVATTLFIAQFWASWSWTKGVSRWAAGKQNPRYHRVRQQECEMDDIRGDKDLNYGVVSRERCLNGFGGVKKRKSRAKGKIGSLNIDTADRYAGLGIAVPGHDTTVRAMEARRSFDEDVVQQTPKSAGTARNAYFTAPLQSTPYFTPIGHVQLSKPPLSAFEAGADMEACRSPYPRLSAESPEFFDVTSPLHETLHSSGCEDGDASGIVFRERINDGVRGVAEKLARMFHDHVDTVAGPEEGLLLPIREQEREKPMVKGLFVE